MATIVNNPPATVDTESGAAGWAVAIIVILVALVAGIYFYNHYAGGSTTNINVSVPGVTGGTSGGTSGGSGNTGGTSGQ